MSMTVSRPGQANGTGDADALFRTQFAGEVITSFSEKNVTLNRHSVRTIPKGNGADHYFIGKGGGGYHTPGEQLTGRTQYHAKKSIMVDSLLVADRFIDNLDEAMVEHEVRQHYSFDCGRFLAKCFDMAVLRCGLLAARTSAVISGGNGGSAVISANALTDADALAKAIYDAGTVLDEKDIPEDERACFLKPAQYDLLAQNKDAINKDWGGEGSYAAGSITRINNIELVKTNNFPRTSVGSTLSVDGVDLSIPSTTQGDFTNSAALVMRREAVGTTKLLDLSVEMGYLIDYQGHLIVAKYAIGHDVLQPDCAVEIRIA